MSLIFPNSSNNLLKSTALASNAKPLMNILLGSTSVEYLNSFSLLVLSRSHLEIKTGRPLRTLRSISIARMTSNSDPNSA